MAKYLSELFKPEEQGIMKYFKGTKQSTPSQKKLWTYHYPDYATGKAVAIQALSQTEAKKQAQAMGLSTTEVLPTWRGKKYKETGLKEIGTQVGEVGERVKEIRTQLGEGVTPTEDFALPKEPKEPKGLPGEPEEEKVTTGLGTYNIGTIQSDLTTAGAEKKKAYDEMIGLQASLYDTEYEKAGMGGIKDKIAKLDTDVADRKARRDQALLDEKGKPIPQWMITGRKALEIEAATNDLNRFIDQRNSLAEDYNTGIDEVTRKVGYGTQDAATQYGYWEGEEKRLTDLMGTYQSLLTAELGREEEAERFEKGFGLEEKLYELKKAEAGKPTEYTPPTSYREWQLADTEMTFEEWLTKTKKLPGEMEVPGVEDFVTIFQLFKDKKYTREEVEKQFRAENKMEEGEELPIVVVEALDRIFGKKKEGLLSQIWHRLPGVK